MRKLLLVLVSIVVIALTWGIMLVTDADRHVIQTSFVEEVLEETDLGDAVSAMLVEEMTGQLPPDIPPIFQEQISVAVSDVFDAQWAEQTILGLSSELLPVIRGEEDEYSAAIDITDEKEQLENTLTAQLNELSDEELQEYGTTRMELEMMMGMVLPQVTEGLPDQLDILEMLEGMGMELNVGELQEEYQVQRGRSQTIMFITIPAAIILYIVLAGIAGALRWSGWSLIIAGGLYLIVFVIARGVLPGVAEQIELPPEIDLAAVTSVIRMAIGKFMFSPMVTVAVGVILVVLSIFIPKWRKPAQEKTGSAQQ